MEITTNKYKVNKNNERTFFVNEPAGKNVYINNIEADYSETNEALNYDTEHASENDISINVVKFTKNEEAEKEREEQMKAIKEEIHNMAFTKELTFPDNDYDRDNEHQVRVHVMEKINEEFEHFFGNISRRLRANSPKLKSLPGYVTFKSKIKELGFGWWEKENGSLKELEESLHSGKVRARLKVMFEETMFE